jgi:hypothetical protein
MKDEVKNRILSKKLEALKKLGIKPPKDREEEKKRLKDAHGY